MKLSDAVLLGSTTGHKLSNGSWNCCLLGMGVAAVVQCSDAKQEAVARWPWLSDYMEPSYIPSLLPWLRRYAAEHPHTIDGYVFLTALCCDVLDKKITLEQAVDAIRSVEPQDEPITASLTAPLETALPVQGQSQEATAGGLRFKG